MGSNIYLVNVDKIARNRVKEEGARKVWIQVLIDRHRAATFIMRRFLVKPGGETPLHSHRWEHEVFVLKGLGIVTDGKAKLSLKPGIVVYIPPNKRHQFKNVANGRLEFLCIIPK